MSTKKAHIHRFPVLRWVAAFVFGVGGFGFVFAFFYTGAIFEGSGLADEQQHKNLATAIFVASGLVMIGSAIEMYIFERKPSE